MQRRYLLTVLIPTFNGMSRISCLLDSLQHTGYLRRPDVEILIGDNCSVDGSQEYLKSLELPINIIVNNANLGFNGNVLKLSHLAQGQYVWILGDDDQVRLHSSILLDLLSTHDEPKLFVSQEEYDSLMLDPFSARMIPVIPFGFISSTIHPNTQAIRDHLILFARENQHQSPHFFARWKFFLENGRDSLVNVDYCHNLATRVCQPRDHGAISGQLFLSYLSTLITPWIKRHNCWNWFHAYKVSLSIDKSLVIAEFLLKAERTFLYTEITHRPARGSIYWLSQLPYFFAKDLSYGWYMLFRVSEALRMIILKALSKMIRAIANVL